MLGQGNGGVLGVVPKVGGCIRLPRGGGCIVTNVTKLTLFIGFPFKRKVQEAMQF